MSNPNQANPNQAEIEGVMDPRLAVLSRACEIIETNERGQEYGDFSSNMEGAVMGVRLFMGYGNRQEPAPNSVRGMLHMLCLKLVRIMNACWSSKPPHQDSYVDAIVYLLGMYESHMQHYHSRTSVVQKTSQKAEAVMDQISTGGSDG